MMHRPRLAHERGATSPLTAHAEPEQNPERRELPQVGGGSAQRRRNGINQDTPHERFGAAKAVGNNPEHYAAAGRREQRDRAEHAGLLFREMQITDDARKHERVEHDVKGVERPAKSGRNQ